MGQSQGPAIAEQSLPTQFSLEAPASSWSSSSDARWLWAVDASAWEPSGGTSSAEFAALLDLLPPGTERETVTRSPKQKDHKLALIGRLLVRRACACAVGMDDFSGLTLGRTKGGKPYLVSPLPPGLPNFNFNVSHDGNWVVLASDPLRLVGVDVSAPQRARGDPEDDAWFTDLQVVLTEGEQALITEQACARSRYAAFQRIWSAKEAVTKAVGTGLEMQFDQIEVDLDNVNRNNPPKLFSWSPRTAAPLVLKPEVGGAQPQASVVLDSSGDAEAWAIQQYCLPGDHWVSVALGAVEQAVDANGGFMATFRSKGIHQAARRFSASCPPVVPEILKVEDLVPLADRARYKALSQTIGYAY